MRGSVATVRERVGGRFAFSWVMVAGTLPFLLVGLVVTELPPSQWFVDGPAVALVALAAHGVIAIGFLVGRAIWRPGRQERPIELWKLVLWFVLIAEIRVAVLVWGLDWVGTDYDIPLWSRIVTSGLLLPLTFLFSAYSLESMARYREARKKLIESIVEAESFLERQADAVGSLRDAFLGSLDQKISAANEETVKQVNDLAQRISDGEDTRPELQTLLERADSRWRSISHSAWREARINVPATGVKEFIDTMARSRPLSSLAIIAASVFIFSLGLGRTLPLVTAIATALGWLIVMLAAVWVVNELSARAKGLAPLVFALGVIGLGAVGLGFYAIPGASPEQVSGAFGLHISVVVTSLLIGLGPALAENQRLVTEALARHLDQASIRRLRVEGELLVVARKVAGRLHSETRGSFLAHILNLQRALEQSDTQQALEEIGRIQHTLAQGQLASSVETNRSEIQAFLANWRSLVNIDSNLHTTKIPETIRETVYAIVMDAVADAVRHGGADWVEISLETGADSSVLSVVNNGTLEDTAPPGLGSARLDQWAPGSWSRQVDVLGFVRLRVHLTHESATTS
ncbi:hypothetical protein [Pontimonas sp.]|uniref:hypothetical protein n=1 Tax=Pontimonas sp. TaxID=2304492 RepID=UPI0028708C9F|nr:hypothetical protein [Pontimonas sp.]MDR9397181.1 hypothetical protein [Pontimonas sp.]